MKKSSFSTRTVVAIGIGTALFFVLARFVSIPSPVPNTNIATQYGLLGLVSVVFGPLAGTLVAFIGHCLADLSYGGAPWFSWVFASAFVGFGIGFGCKSMNHLEEGELGLKGILQFNIVQVVSNLIAWGIVAPGLDILIYKEPIEKVFAQGLFAGISNIVTTGIIGTLLLIAYAATKTKKGSLTKKE
ncbi:MAG: ECF-type riboflavin transporter substrate-binding protein [Angelakisella sp.]